MMFLTSIIEKIPGYDLIEKFINSTIDLDKYMGQAFDFIEGLDAVTLVIGVVLAAVIFVMGTFELIKKLSKLIIVVGVLVGLFLLYNSGALDSLLP